MTRVEDNIARCTRIRMSGKTRMQRYQNDFFVFISAQHERGLNGTRTNRTAMTTTKSQPKIRTPVVGTYYLYVNAAHARDGTDEPDGWSSRRGTRRTADRPMCYCRQSRLRDGCRVVSTRARRLRLWCRRRWRTRRRRVEAIRARFPTPCDARLSWRRIAPFRPAGVGEQSSAAGRGEDDA